MAYILVLILAAAVLVLAALLVRLLRQLNTWADLLESTGADSNLRLPAALRLRPVLRSCRAINGRLDQASSAPCRPAAAGRNCSPPWQPSATTSAPHWRRPAATWS